MQLFSGAAGLCLDHVLWQIGIVPATILDYLSEFSISHGRQAPLSVFVGKMNGEPKFSDDLVEVSPGS